MSWRLSWYKVDKDAPLKFNEEEDGSVYPEANGNMILWAEGTSIWLDMTEEDRHNPLYFKELYEDEDCDFFEVTKAGVAKFIEGYRQIIVKAYKEGMKPDDTREFNWPAIDKYDNEKMWEWDRNLVYDLESKSHEFELVTSWKYEYNIFNLIAVYKLFDFEHYKLIVIGG